MQADYEIELGERKLKFEVGKLAKRASASIFAKYGETIVLATVCSQESAAETDFLPLVVDYEERLYAGGRISTSRFIKREGRPSEEAILSARLIDRAIRPLFDPNFNDEVQVVITVLSYDGENDHQILAANAASCALSLSGIPWQGPVGTIRVGRIKDEFILNPTEPELEFSDLDLVISSTPAGIVMVEAAALQIPENVIVEALKFGQKHCLKIFEEIGKMRRTLKGTLQLSFEAPNQKQILQVKNFIKKNYLSKLSPNLINDGKLFEEILDNLVEKFSDQISKFSLKKILENQITAVITNQILSGRRLDGRKPDEIRQIKAEVGLLPRTHGSALFTRGETQVLSIVTLGSPSLEQLIEGMTGEETKRFMHHYNFPPFTTGEVKRIGSPNRREIGHGVLAEKALLSIIPKEEKFPYTIRVVSEVLSSAGSTSMASICGSSLALMDAGVPIGEPVAGLSIGSFSKNGKRVLLSDIAYAEDSAGEMDFKVAGTKLGITAIQMDLKITGLEVATLKDVLEQAQVGRLQILSEMGRVLAKSRAAVSPFAPKVKVVKINPAKIGEVIGSGGKVIKQIMAQTNTVIDVEDDGTVSISGVDQQSCDQAALLIESIAKQAKVGEIFEGTVKRILPFGAMVEYLPGKEGLVHISQLANFRVGNISDVVKVGQKVKVKVTEIDNLGRVNLTMKFGREKPGPSQNLSFKRRFKTWPQKF